MQLEDIHALVNSQPRVDVLHQGAAHSGEEANDHGDPGAHVASGRGNTDQASDGTLTGTNNAEAPLVLDVINDAPADNASRGSGVGVEDDQHSTDRHAERGATVEAEPAEPDENGAEEDKRDVVRLLARRGLAQVLALAEDEGVSQGTAARGDVYGTATSKVERGELA